MSEHRRLDRAVQDFLDGRMDRDELRAVFAGEGATDRLDEELAAYRSVWAALGQEPTSTLPPTFARTVARRAAREREAALATDGAEILAGASATAALAAAVVVAALLTPRAGIDSAGVLEALLRAATSLPPAVWGSVGAGALLYALDTLATAVVADPPFAR